MGAVPTVVASALELKYLEIVIDNKIFLSSFNYFLAKFRQLIPVSLSIPVLLRKFVRTNLTKIFFKLDFVMELPLGEIFFDINLKQLTLLQKQIISNQNRFYPYSVN